MRLEASLNASLQREFNCNLYKALEYLCTRKKLIIYTKFATSFNFNDTVESEVLACEWSRTWNRVCGRRSHLLVYQRQEQKLRDLCTYRVDVDQNARVCRLVCTWDGDCRGGLRARATRNIDLRTFHVELCAALAASCMKGNDLSAQEVLAWSNAAGDSDCLDTFVGDLEVIVSFVTCP